MWAAAKPRRQPRTWPRPRRTRRRPRRRTRRRRRSASRRRRPGGRFDGGAAAARRRGESGAAATATATTVPTARPPVTAIANAVRGSRVSTIPAATESPPLPGGDWRRRRCPAATSVAALPGGDLAPAPLPGGSMIRRVRSDRRGSGYIGSQTAKAVAAAGLEPIVFDNLVYGHEWAVKWGSAGARQSRRSRAAGGRGCKRHSVDAVIHFAAYAYVGESVTNPRKYFGNNVAGIAEPARRDAGRTACATVVFSSHVRDVRRAAATCRSPRTTRRRP